MPFIYLPVVDSVMVRVTKTASTSIIRTGFKIDKDELEFAMKLPSNWSDKFRFAFVRNPFDRLVSAWQMFQKHPSAREIGFDGSRLTIAQVLRVVEDDSIDIYDEGYWGKLRRHAMPMSHAHYNIQDVGFFGRFERLEQDWRSLCEILSMEYQPLGRFKSSGRCQHYSDFYDSKTREVAARIFAEDLEMFSYCFESGIRKAP